MSIVSSTQTRSSVWKSLFSLINSNKPTGWTVVSAIPDSKKAFPCIVIHHLKIGHIIRSLSREKRSYEIECKIEFFAFVGDKKEKIDEGRDNIQNTILNSTNDLRVLGLSYDDFKDIDTDVMQIDEENQLNTGEIQIKFRGS